MSNRKVETKPTESQREAIKFITESASTILSGILAGRKDQRNVSYDVIDNYVGIAYYAVDKIFNLAVESILNTSKQTEVEGNHLGNSGDEVF